MRVPSVFAAEAVLYSFCLVVRGRHFLFVRWSEAVTSVVWLHSSEFVAVTSFCFVSTESTVVASFDVRPKNRNPCALHVQEMLR